MPLPSQWKPGDSAELTRTVSDEDIALFTRISGDRNPLHYDPEAAKASRFGEIVVQGGVTSAILNAVVAEKLPGPGDRLPERQLELHRACPARGRHHRQGRGRGSPAGQANHDAAHVGDPRGRDGRAGGNRGLLHDGADSRGGSMTG